MIVPHEDCLNCQCRPEERCDGCRDDDGVPLAVNLTEIKITLPCVAIAVFLIVAKLI